MRGILIIALMLLSVSGWAQDTRPVKRGPAAQEALPPQPEKSDGTVPVEVTEGAPSSVPVDPKTLEESDPPRSADPNDKKWAVTGDFSYLDLWVPGKLGLSAGYRWDMSNMIEINYLNGSLSGGTFGIDLGRIVETRASLVWRRFPSQRAYNYFFGINYNDLELVIGEVALASVAAANPEDYELLKLTTMGLSAGLGHRWVFSSGFTLAVDWLQVHVPLTTLTENAPFRDATTDPDRRKEADDLIRYVKNFPRIAALKLQLGISF